MRRSTRSLMTCSQRQASSWTYAQSRPMTSARSRSARRCLRITSVARFRPVSVSSRCRSPETTTSPSRSIRPMVCETVGPEWRSRSAIRARRATMFSSSSSKIVRRYISVVSIRSVIQLSSSSTVLASVPPYRAAAFPVGLGEVDLHPPISLRGNGLAASARPHRGPLYVRDQLSLF
ncbi:hypothetical protein D9M72_338640 [compost metagenome]